MLFKSNTDATLDRLAAVAVMDRKPVLFEGRVASMVTLDGEVELGLAIEEARRQVPGERVHVLLRAGSRDILAVTTFAGDVVNAYTA